MTWENPKTNWKAGDSPSSSDFNRIEENIDILGRLDRTSAYGVATGTNNYAVTLNPNPLTYYEGMCIAVKIPNQNTGSSTLNVNGLGAKPIRKQNGSAVSSGNLKAGIIYTMRYDGTNFILQGEGGEGTAQEGDVVKGKTFTNDEGTFTGSLELTGDARRSDVVEGKTYYRDNPKEKLIGTLPEFGIERLDPPIWTEKSLGKGKYNGVRVNTLSSVVRQLDSGTKEIILDYTGQSAKTTTLKSNITNGEVVYAGCQVLFYENGEEFNIPLVYFVTGWNHAPRYFRRKYGTVPNLDMLYMSTAFNKDTKVLTFSHQIIGYPEWRDKNVTLKWEVRGVPY